MGSLCPSGNSGLVLGGPLSACPREGNRGVRLDQRCEARPCLARERVRYGTLATLWWLNLEELPQAEGDTEALKGRDLYPETSKREDPVAEEQETGRPTYLMCREALRIQPGSSYYSL